jgi:probable F420-dependent oxidoreductase
MRIGFSVIETVDTVAVDELARGLEERGYDSLWLGEHTHIPASRETPYPGGGDIPESYIYMIDPYIGLMAAAAATETLLIGTGISLALEHDIFALGKATATLDRLSGGRLIMGVGVGWNREELANHTDVPWARRYQAIEECVGALRTLWTDSDSEFHGEFYDFDPVWSQPKPLSSPLKVFCGMGGNLGMEHAIRWANGWMPMDRVLGSLSRGEIELKLATFREMASAAGRDNMPITLHAIGNPTVETLRRYAEMGVERTIVGGLRPRPEPPNTTNDFIDHYANFIPELM